jgi:hypothetical protein
MTLANQIETSAKGHLVSRVKLISTINQWTLDQRE